MIKILTTNDENEWNNALERISSSRRDIYFTPAYYKLYEHLGDGTALCFVHDNGKEIGLYPFLKNEINSLGYNLPEKYFDIQGAYGYNGVLTDSLTPAFADEFYNALSNYCHENKVVAEFTRFHPLLANYNFNNGYFNIIDDRICVYFDLMKPRAEIFRDFQHTTRKQIRRASGRYGIEVVTDINGTEWAGDVFQIYSTTMNRVGAVKALYFNEEFFRELLSLKGAVLFRALLHGKLIAFIIGFSGGEYFHGHLGGSLEEYINMSPNGLLYWTMINYAADNGFRYLHIGGGDTPDADNSLLKFKLNYSKATLPFKIGKRIHNPEVYDEIVRQWSARCDEAFVQSQTRILLKYRNL
jgi:hypothetical protein